MAIVSKVYQVSDKEFQNIIKNNYTYSDCLRALGLSTNGGSSTDILKKRISELGCDTSHFTQKLGKIVNNKKQSLTDILVENSTYMNISCLKKRLISEQILEYKCDICGITEWNGMPIALQLDHKNGIHNDHRLENIRFLCPNCHSQTETYAGKNHK